VEHLRKRSMFPAQVSKILEVKLFYTVAANWWDRTAVLLETEILLVSGYLLWSLAERTQLDYSVQQGMLVIIIFCT
jgi:hypothetical protein